MLERSLSMREVSDGGVAQMVERSLSTREVPRTRPGDSALTLSPEDYHRRPGAGYPHSARSAMGA